MAVEPAEARTPVSEAHPTVFVDTFTDGLLGPDLDLLGPVEDGGHIVVNTTPGCWGPMMPPSLQGGHEVCQPAAVGGAEPRDAVAIRITDVEVTSIATASGNDWSPDGSYNGDPYCAAVCPSCGAEYPETRLEGIGQESVRCASCGRSEEHTSELQSRQYLVCRLLLAKKKKKQKQETKKKKKNKTTQKTNRI